MFCHDVGGVLGTLEMICVSKLLSWKLRLTAHKDEKGDIPRNDCLTVNHDIWTGLAMNF